MRNKDLKTTIINPAQPEEVKYWTKKWGISDKQLNDAILETGSLNANDIKTYLKSNNMLAPFYNFFYKLYRRNTGSDKRHSFPQPSGIRQLFT